MISKNPACARVFPVQGDAAIVFFSEMKLLDHRAHCTVQNQDALLKELLDRIGRARHDVLHKKPARILSWAAMDRSNLGASK
jgi:hypothetical protein